MALNLVGIFDDPTVAEQACRQIQQLGIGEHHIRTHSNAAGMGASSNGGREHRGLLSRMFGGGSSGSNDLGGHYAEAVRRGSSVVSVHLEHEEKAPQVERILEQAGAIDVNDRVQAWQASGYTGHDLDAPDYTPDQIARERETLEVLQEELRVGKRQVQTGGVRVHRHVTETPVNEQVTLREERAVVERHPVNREATSADLRSFEAGAGDIEIREMREEAVVDKRARVVEEVSIGKEAIERTENIEDTVRRTDVDVEQLDASQQGLLNRQGSTTSPRQDRTL